MKKTYLLICVLMAFPLLIRAQISGVVTDQNGTPLIGVVVQTADATQSTVTDFDGYFELNISEGTPIQAAFLGYKTVNANAQKQMQIIMRQKGAKPIMPQGEDDIPWSMFVLANGMTAIPFSPAVGLTIGMVREFGWYINAMTGFGFHMHDGVSRNGLIPGSIDVLPFYTGESSKQTFSVTAGGVARLGKAPVYVYLGVGWAYKTIAFQTNDNKWIAYETEPYSNWSPLHSVALETGLTANIKGFALSIGYEPLIGIGGYNSSKNAAHEIKIGLGGMFNLKRRTGK